MTGVAYPVSALTPASVPVLLILRKFTCCAQLGGRKGVWARSWSRDQEGRGWGERGVGTVGGEVASGKRRYAGFPLGGAKLNKI